MEGEQWHHHLHHVHTIDNALKGGYLDASPDEEAKNKNDMIDSMPVAANGLILYKDLF